MSIKSKRGSIPAITVLALIIVAMAAWYCIGIAKRECSKDTDCASEYYCGSDFKCHEPRIIERTVNNYDFKFAASVLGIALVVCALILRRRDNNKEIPQVQGPIYPSYPQTQQYYQAPPVQKTNTLPHSQVYQPQESTYQAPKQRTPDYSKNTRSIYHNGGNLSRHSDIPTGNNPNSILPKI